MREPDPLPYTIRTRDAATMGLSRKALHGDEFVRVRRGVNAPSGLDPRHPDVRIAAVAAQLTAPAVIGGWAAARLHERLAGADALEVFDGGPRWEEMSRGRPSLGPARVVVCAPRESRLALRDDVRIFRSPVRQDERLTYDGVPITSPLRTALDLARLLPRPRAVVAVDRMLHLRLVHADDLVRVVGQRPNWRGVPAARRVIALMDDGAESPQETLLRLLWMASGYPRPRCNPVVRDPDGRFLARVDLIDQDAGVVGEYDGTLHADGAQRSRDACRQEGLEDVGLVVVRATSDDVGPDAAGPRWQGRLAAAYRRAAERPPGRKRWVVTAD